MESETQLLARLTAAELSADKTSQFHTPGAVTGSVPNAGSVTGFVPWKRYLRIDQVYQYRSGTDKVHHFASMVVGSSPAASYNSKMSHIAA